MSLVSRTKNRHGHWVCWMSTGKRYGLTWRTHTHNGASHATLSIETPCKMRHHNPGESATHTLREEKTYWKYWKQNKRGQRITQLAKASFDIFSRRSAWSLTHGKYFCVPVARHEKQHELHHVETRMQLRFLVSTRNKPTGKSGNRTSTADTSRSLQRQVSTYISYLNQSVEFTAHVLENNFIKTIENASHRDATGQRGAVPCFRLWPNERIALIFSASFAKRKCIIFDKRSNFFCIFTSNSHRYSYLVQRICEKKKGKKKVKLERKQLLAAAGMSAQWM